jgi:hypothetical protein
VTDPRVRIAALIGLSAWVACSSGGGGPSVPYAPCDEASRVGSFTVDLKPELNGAPPYAQVNGVVRDSVDPKDVWDEIAREGECQVLVGPELGCAPACGAGMVCRAGVCAPAPTAHSVGMVTITGLAVPLVMTPNATNSTYYGPIPAGTAYPPYELGATVALEAEGGDLSAFTLEARGIAPLAVPDGQTLAIATTGANGPMLVRWTAADASTKGRMRMSLDIAHHAGIAAELRCDVPDSGMATIPGRLLDALVARGTAGFPEIVLTRVSADSTVLAPGCVELDVASSVARQLTVEGVTSCTQDSDCTAPQVCRPELKCG